MRTELLKESLNMKTYSDYPPVCHPVSGLPLFDWQPLVALRPATRAGLHLTRRYRIHPSIADVVAGLAGLGANREAR